MNIVLIKPDISKFTKITNFIMIVIFIAFLILSFIWDFSFGKTYIPMAIILSFFGLGLVKLVRSFVIKDFKRIGEISFGIDNIAIEADGMTASYALNKIDSIKVYYFGYDGESYPISIAAGRNIMQKQGDKNKVEIETNGEAFSYEFYLNRYNEKTQLFRTINYYKKNGVNINLVTKFRKDNDFNK